MSDTTARDPFALNRFLAAQDGRDPHHPGISWNGIVTELRAGHKTGHWIWFVFPQVDLGHSPTAHHFAIMSRAEAAAYLAHPVLGPRLRECTDLMLATPGTDPVRVLGHVDAKKFRSSMTLFQCVAVDETKFAEALDRFFGGRADLHTVRFLEAYADEG